ncbi:nucleotide exchange factor GrpE [Tersicoccus sp. Bi-70]|uniref:nucleotide exchange factor GrpE n=1 Tax=Tersicoccus sp. Bi-70 TaxID=1897634 RepID=UPI000977EC12|nr:nucleotide exchange factor GrpE [Tersicoccus sp. Bi-70]OMH34371.1 nucleotide exchange factor GrpE [Tersicoccus sp. Bi-70]
MGAQTPGEPREPGRDGENGEGPVFRDNRRIDPVTGEVRGAGADQPTGAEQPGQPADGADRDVVAEAEAILDGAGSDDADGAGTDATAAPANDAEQLAAERLADLQRLQAEFVNYRRRVDRDRDVARGNAVISVLTALLPVLDDLDAARQHGDLTAGPFASIAAKLDAVLTQQGLERYGEVGTVFDPAVHEALLQQPSDVVESGHVSHVLRSGYRVGDRVLRAAQVGVAS